MNLSPTLRGTAGVIDVSAVLGMLSQGGMSGTFRLGEGWIRLGRGMIVDCSPGGAVGVVSAMLRARDVDFTFRAVPGMPNGGLALGVVGVLLECARLEDENGVVG